MATLVQAELWSTFEAAGGTRLAFLPLPANAEDDVGLDGNDSAKAAWPKGLAVLAQVTRGRVIRFCFATPAGTVSYDEWEVRRTEVATGSETLFGVELVGPQWQLAKVPIETTDGDGFVYESVPAYQLTRQQTVEDVILAGAPAWLTPGTIADSTERTEIQFDGDNALSGAAKYAQLLGLDWWLSRDGTTAYDLHFGTRGASAPVLRVRTGKNLLRLTRTEGGDQVNRVRIRGATTDEGTPANLGWAYLRVNGISGDLITLGPIHGTGGNVIGYDDQFNHANLGYTVYLRKIGGTTTAVLDTLVATQQVQVADATGITVGDWIRLVTSSTGRHLTRLDAPADIATDGVEAGETDLPWDDTVNILDNPLMLDYPTTPGLPTGYAGSGTTTRETGDGLHLTGGQSAKIVVGSGSVETNLLTRSRTWRVEPRRWEFSGSIWILITALSGGTIGFRLTRNGVAIGETVRYRSPINVWRQLKAEALSLLGDVGASPAIGFQLVAILDPGAGVITATLYADSVQISPSRAVRPITLGSNAARLLQQGQLRLEERRRRPFVHTLQAADLERAGLPRTAAIEVGGSVVIDADELNVLGLQGRFVRRRRDLRRDLLTEVTISTDDRVPGRLAEPTAIVLPFREALENRTADRDDRQAVQTLKAEITATTASQVTITLTHSDLRNGTPAISYVLYGTVTYVSGSGLGPYVFNRATAASGIGAVIFTSKIPGRSDVTAAVEVPEVDYLDVGSIVPFFASDAGSVSVRLEGSAPTLSWRYAVSTSAMPSDATVNAATPVDGRSLDLTSLATLDFGQTIYLKAKAYTATAGGGTASAFITATHRRDNKVVSKTLRVPFAAFRPRNHTTTWIYNSASYVQPGSTGVDEYFLAALPLPKGVTIRAVRWRWYRSDASQDIDMYLFKAVDTTETTLASVIGPTGTGWNTSSVGSLSQLVGDEIYTSLVKMNADTLANLVRLHFVEIDYDAPTLVTTL